MCYGRSRDKYWRSSYLKFNLKDCPYSEALLEPESISDIQNFVQLAHQMRVPMILRGSGNGNLAGAFSTEGGLIIHFEPKMNQIIDFDSQKGIIVCQPGATIEDIRHISLNHGWDLKVYPTTSDATIAGFISCAEYGIGSIDFGSIRNYGNIYNMKVMTVEDMPKVIEVDAKDPTLLSGIPLSLGTTGIICEISLTLAPAIFHIDMAIAFETVEECIEFAQMIYYDSTVNKRSMTIYPNSQLLQYINEENENLKGSIPPNQSVLLVTISEANLPFIQEKVKRMNGKTIFVDYNRSERESLDEIRWQKASFKHSKSTELRDYSPFELLIEDTNSLLSITNEFEKKIGNQIYWQYEFIKTNKGKLGCIAISYLQNSISLSNAEEELSKLIQSKMILSALNPNKLSIENIYLGYNHTIRRQIKSRFDPNNLLSIRKEDKREDISAN